MASILHLQACRTDPTKAPDAAQPESEKIVESATWIAPADPSDVPGGDSPRVAVLGASWCQWCMVLHQEVLPRADVRAAFARTFALAEVDVDTSPEWMNLPGVDGLPALVFFNRDGRHVLSRSGFRDAAELSTLLSAVAAGIASGEIRPYPSKPTSVLDTRAISAADAAGLLATLERALFFKINSNDGGFDSPSRDPHPKVLVELQAWVSMGAPPRVNDWIEKTVQGASRGGSPALNGEPLPDMAFSEADLILLSKQGSAAGPRWRAGITDLPTQDPYLGLQDPFDHGFFRYAAGPGWYNPHFERFADENLAWAIVLSERGRESKPTLDWVWKTFRRPDGWMNRAQQSDPFYYRLTRLAREGVQPPAVAAFADYGSQAWAVRADPTRCSTFLDALPTTWPHLRVDAPSGPAATPEVVGEVLVAAADCDGAARAKPLADAAVKVWERGLPADARLHRLAAGLCAVDHPRCLDALGAATREPIDLRFAPPLTALANAARR